MKKIVELKYMTTYKIEVDCDIDETKKRTDKQIKHCDNLIEQAKLKVKNGEVQGITEPWSNTMYNTKAL